MYAFPAKINYNPSCLFCCGLRHMNHDAAKHTNTSIERANNKVLIPFLHFSSPGDEIAVSPLQTQWGCYLSFFASITCIYARMPMLLNMLERL